MNPFGVMMVFRHALKHQGQQSAVQSSVIQKMLLKDLADPFIVTTLIVRSLFVHNQDVSFSGLMIR